MSHLLDLIGLCFRALRPQVNNFCNAVSRENVITSSSSFFEAKSTHESKQVIETNIRIRPSAQNLIEYLGSWRHVSLESLHFGASHRHQRSDKEENPDRDRTSTSNSLAPPAVTVSSSLRAFPRDRDRSP